jgi:hypothetical protein
LNGTTTFNGFSGQAASAPPVAPKAIAATAPIIHFIDMLFSLTVLVC